MHDLTRKVARTKGASQPAGKLGTTERGGGPRTQPFQLTNSAIPYKELRQRNSSQFTEHSTRTHARSPAYAVLHAHGLVHSVRSDATHNYTYTILHMITLPFGGG